MPGTRTTVPPSAGSATATLVAGQVIRRVPSGSRLT